MRIVGHLCCKILRSLMLPQNDIGGSLPFFATPPIYLPDNPHHFHIYENGEMM